MAAAAAGFSLFAHLPTRDQRAPSKVPGRSQARVLSFSSFPSHSSHSSHFVPSHTAICTPTASQRSVFCVFRRKQSVVKMKLLLSIALLLPALAAAFPSTDRSSCNKASCEKGKDICSKLTGWRQQQCYGYICQKEPAGRCNNCPNCDKAGRDAAPGDVTIAQPVDVALDAREQDQDQSVGGAPRLCRVGIFNCNGCRKWWDSCRKIRTEKICCRNFYKAPQQCQSKCYCDKAGEWKPPCNKSPFEEAVPAEEPEHEREQSRDQSVEMPPAKCKAGVFQCDACDDWFKGCMSTNNGNKGQCCKNIPRDAPQQCQLHCYCDKAGKWKSPCGKWSAEEQPEPEVSIPTLDDRDAPVKEPSIADSANPQPPDGPQLSCSPASENCGECSDIYTKYYERCEREAKGKWISICLIFTCKSWDPLIAPVQCRKGCFCDKSAKWRKGDCEKIPIWPDQAQMINEKGVEGAMQELGFDPTTFFNDPLETRAETAIEPAAIDTKEEEGLDGEQDNAPGICRIGIFDCNECTKYLQTCRPCKTKYCMDGCCQNMYNKGPHQCRKGCYCDFNDGIQACRGRTW
ncbi:hypothetical protein K491DRAFT_119193 [Lophiostoma macrostomum CBS 122681]|uniref:Uncharacterized protein n=1 Tax=Lophiostoma macrostomum CBS 122681 TaxID=1314788 RepID=A0A6A6SUM2_9PLEO|nr:hypothetical protein K491DRAFT_119193 [Lophiostoma macrostomum CBS 122681]